MNGTKWYKLNKSNESLQVFLEERFTELEDEISKKISSAIVNIGELIFSAGLAFALEKDMDPLQFIWNKFSILQSQSFCFIREAISCTSIFVLTIGICHLLIWGIRKIQNSIIDNKATPKDAYRLQKYFYMQVLNDIVTGISLEKKACELAASTKKNKTEFQDLEDTKKGIKTFQNMESIQESETPVQDSDLYIIYLMESVFYFNEATHNITKNNIFEIYNPGRENYTEFLKVINPDNICNIIEICISTLDRIKAALEAKGQNSQMAQDAKELFSAYKDSIEKQILETTKNEKQDYTL